MSKIAASQDLSTNACSPQLAQSLKSPKSGLQYLQGYIPESTDVIIGRGKKFFNHKGNKNLREIVDSKIEEYKMAVTKREKSQVLEGIVAQIRTGGKIIKKDTETNLWFDVGDVLAKEKISQTFRDLLAGSYKSSNEFKRKRRVQMRREETLRSAKRRRFQSFIDGSDQTMYGKPARSLDSETNNDMSWHNPLSHQAYVQDNPFEPTPIQEMMKWSGIIPGYNMKENRCINVKNSKNSDETGNLDHLEDISTAGLQ